MKLNRLLILGFLVLPFSIFAVPVSNYKTLSMRGVFQEHSHFIIRKFHQQSSDYFLIVNPQTGKTQVVTANLVTGLAFCKIPFGQTGLVLNLAPSDSVVLTMDLCPSSKPLVREIIANIPQNVRRPVPIGIAISGRWIIQHREDLDWIKAQEASGQIHITWINHSLSHAFNPRAPLTLNFLLTPGTRLQDEILTNEQIMLENGLTPSIFFRCPGLVSDAHVSEQLKAYNLVPLGANGWLGKGEPAGAGRIILVHGTGNEPEGVRRLLAWYERLTQGEKVSWVSSEALLLPSVAFEM